MNSPTTSTRWGRANGRPTPRRTERGEDADGGYAEQGDGVNPREVDGDNLPRSKARELGPDAGRDITHLTGRPPTVVLARD
ncbi:hypothetical protein [Streptomyces cyaneus]|uniref:hypothetical protein n=1 Tax=Streptomyces cyaneus TaxID=1904 RepID=UPI000FF8A43B|nr:hypothetical protein [Streptomyces cyaneus]